MLSPRRLGTFLLFASVALVAAGCGGDDEAKDTGGSGGGGEGKELFVSSCGSCHTMQAAGTSGAVGPSIDQLQPTKDTVLRQIENGGGGMPAGLLKGADAETVAEYVEANAGG